MSDELNMSSVTADPAPETAGKRAAPEEKPPKTPGKRAGLIIGIAAAVLVLAYAGCCVAANALYSHTAFPNTSVLGMDMSGLSAQEAEQRWTEQGSALLDGMTIRLTRDGQEIGSTTLSDLGVTVLPVYVSKAAGCDVQDRGWGSDVTAFLRGGWRFIESWFRAVDVTPQLDVDEAKLTAACERSDHDPPEAKLPPAPNIAPINRSAEPKESVSKSTQPNTTASIVYSHEKNAGSLSSSFSIPKCSAMISKPNHAPQRTKFMLAPCHSPVSSQTIARLRTVFHLPFRLPPNGM